MKNNMKVTVTPLYSIEDMWKTARDMARQTVNKRELEKPVSEKFKKDSLISEHSPIRELRFKIKMENIPTYVAQQFSRHRIATNSGDFLHENINPTDVEHYVQTQRTDRTGKERGSQEAPVNYTFTTNMQGLIDMSKKRSCKAADPMALYLWDYVRIGIAEIDPLFHIYLQPSCIYRGFCPEKMCKCNYINSIAGKTMLNEYRKAASE